MCGIGFASLTKTSTLDPTLIAFALLEALEVRGRDASGLAYHLPEDGGVYYMKQPVPAKTFVADKDVWVPEEARALIAHTRWATQGDPKDEVNNHPVFQPGVCLVHNGHVSNDDDLFDMLDCNRIGEVDSEAIAAALAHGDGGVVARLSLVQGTAAVAWLKPGQADSVLHIARLRQSPVVIGQTRDGDLIGASTHDALLAVAKVLGVKYENVVTVPERVWITAKYGQIHRWQPYGTEGTHVPPTPRRSKWHHDRNMVARRERVEHTWSHPTSEDNWLIESMLARHHEPEPDTEWPGDDGYGRLSLFGH